MQHVVQPEGQHGEGPVGLVAGLAAHRLPPKVVAQQLAERSAGAKVMVVPNGEYVVVNQAPSQTVAVAGEAQRYWEGVPKNAEEKWSRRQELPSL